MSKYTTLLEDVARIAKECGRNPNEITIVVASKTHTWEEIFPLYHAGARDLGESRIQEALPKIAESPKDIRWHLIGTLQVNKVRKVVGVFTLIHSVDSVELAEQISLISQEKGVISHILLQANMSGETSKHGLTAEEWKANLAHLLTLPQIQIDGLMTMAPLSEDKAAIRHCFSGLRQLRDELKQLADGALELPKLSMGMSHDYPIAIQEGATLLRIGTALF